MASCARSRSAGSPARRAGTAAAIAVALGVQPRAVPVDVLQQALLAQGVYLRPAVDADHRTGGLTMANDTVSALDRGLALMQCFSDTRRVLGPTDLSRLTGIPRPSVIRLAATLVNHRWLQPEPGGDRYMLGAGVVSLAQVFLSGLDVRAVARPAMQACADRVAGSVYLAVRDGLELVSSRRAVPARR